MATLKDQLDRAYKLVEKYLSTIERLEAENKRFMKGLGATRNDAGDVEIPIFSKNEQLEADKAELMEGLALARESIFKTCNNAVDKLNEIAPDEGWDSGDSVAEMHCIGLDLLVAKHTGE